MTKSDIVERIRSLRYVHVPQASQLFEEACEEIERLRSRPCPYVTGTVTRYCTLNTSEKPNSSTLTDAEREAVEASREFWQVEADAFAEPQDQHYAATLRGLLERMR